MRDFPSSHTAWLILFNPIVEALSQFAVLSGFQTTRNNGSVNITFDHRQYPLFPLACNDSEGNFYEDPRALVYPLTNISDAMDIFSWSPHALSITHQSAVDWELTTPDCAAQNNQSMICHGNLGQLAIFYPSAYVLRKGIIALLNHFGPLTHCRIATNGFLVTGYEYGQSASISLSALPSFSATASLIPSASFSYTPSHTPHAPTPSESFNFNWLALIIGGGFLLLLTAALLYPRTRTGITGLFTPTSRHREKQSLLTVNHAKKSQV